MSAPVAPVVTTTTMPAAPMMSNNMMILGLLLLVIVAILVYRHMHVSEMGPVMQSAQGVMEAANEVASS